MMNKNSLRQQYDAWCAANPRAAADFREEIEDLLADSGVTYDRVSARVKTWHSWSAKALRINEDGSPTYANPLAEITDLVGVRITTYHSTEIPRVITALGEVFRIIKSVDKAALTRISGSFGYGSHHLIVEVPAGHEDLAAYVGVVFEVQIRTVLQHAWAEFEHDIRYKNNEMAADPQIDRAFTLAAGLIELADQQFDQIAQLNSTPAAANTVQLTSVTLPGVLVMLLGDRYPGNKADQYIWCYNLLTAHEINTVDQLSRLLDPALLAEVTAAMHYRFTPAHVRLVDDVLLAIYGEDHIERTADFGNRPKRETRLRQRLLTLHTAGLMPPQVGEIRASN